MKFTNQGLTESFLKENGCLCPKCYKVKVAKTKPFKLTLDIVLSFSLGPAIV